MWPLIGTFLLLTLLSLMLGAFCAWLQKHFDGISVSEWLLDHFYCPAGRVLLLILTCLLLWPQIEPTLEYGSLFRLLGDGDFLVSSLNILFLGSLVLSFLPLLGHPAIGLPILSALATGVVAAHILPGLPENPRWWPDLATLLQMFIIALAGHLAIRHFASRWAQAYDHHFLVTGSIVLFNDWLYLLLQVPLIIVYGEWIRKTMDLSS